MTKKEMERAIMWKHHERRPEFKLGGCKDWGMMVVRHPESHQEDLKLKQKLPTKDTHILKHSFKQWEPEEEEKNLKDTFIPTDV